MGITHLLLILLLVLVWGFNFVVIKIGLEGMPPVFLAVARFFLTSLPAIFFLKRPKAPFWKVSLYGLTIFAFQFALFFIAIDLGVPPGLSAILMQAHVIFSLLFAVFIFKEKLDRWQIGGMLISFSGIAYAGVHVGGSFSFLGFFLVIAAAFSWAIGSVIAKTLGNVNMLATVVWGSMVAWPPLLLLSLLLEGPEKILYSLEHLSYLSIGAVCYLTYATTVFGYALWNWLIHHLPLSRVAPFTLLVPIVAMISSAIVLQEPMQWWKIIASILVLGGLSIAFFGPHLLKQPK